MQLREWIFHYIKFKDCMKKQIVEIQEKEDSLQVKEKKEDKTYFIHDELEALLGKTKEAKTYYVCLNNKKNIKTLLDNWEKLITNKQLTILFANPATNDVWLINPATHHAITEKESLKEGIESLHISIPPTD